MEITTEIVTAFRLSKPEYKDAGLWPEEVMIDALCEGDAETGGSGWGEFDIDDCQNFKGRGLYFYAAHLLKSTYSGSAICDSNVQTGAKLVVASKSVGDESVTFATGAFATMSSGDAWLATTSYGQQWLRLRRRAARSGRVTGANNRIIRRCVSGVVY